MKFISTADTDTVLFINDTLLDKLQLNVVSRKGLLEFNNTDQTMLLITWQHLGLVIHQQCLVRFYSQLSQILCSGTTSYRIKIFSSTHPFGHMTFISHTVQDRSSPFLIHKAEKDNPVKLSSTELKKST